MTDDAGRPLPDAEPGMEPGSLAPTPSWTGDATGDAAGPPAADPEPEPEPALAPVPAPEPEPEPMPTPSPEPEPASELEPGGRALDLRLARLHLRMGAHSLARAELESCAGGGLLDEPALLDLAEARWRTGDLAGAGEAANAAIGRGVDDPLAFVIAAEATAGLGRPAQARRLAARALEVTGGALDLLFAGMPRSMIWPGEPVPDEAVAALAAGPHGRPPEAFGPASPAAAEAFAGGRGSLARGDVATAALRLGVAIRLEPAFAPAVLSAIGDRATSEPTLALVAGDALRLLGREHEALAAYDTARGKPRDADTRPAEPEPLWSEADGLD